MALTNVNNIQHKTLVIVMDNNISDVRAEKIQQKIYTIRGLQIMLDRDLAELYQVKAI